MPISAEKAALRDAVAAILRTQDFANLATFNVHKERETKDGTPRKPSPKDENDTFGTITIPMDASDGITVGGETVYPSSMTLQISAFHLSPVPYSKSEAQTSNAASASADRLQALLNRKRQPAPAPVRSESK